jgi:hypothetical protein
MDTGPSLREATLRKSILELNKRIGDKQTMLRQCLGSDRVRAAALKREIAYDTRQSLEMQRALLANMASASAAPSPSPIAVHGSGPQW